MSSTRGSHKKIDENRKLEHVNVSILLRISTTIFTLKSVLTQIRLVLLYIIYIWSIWLRVNVSGTFEYFVKITAQTGIILSNVKM